MLNGVKWCLAIPVVLVSLSGCGNGGFDLSGQALFDGESIVAGWVEFTPKMSDGKNLVSSAVVAKIENGRYATTGRSMKPGKYTSRWTAYPEPLPEATEDEDNVKDPVPLFAWYAMDVEVTSSTLDLTVPKEARGYAPK